MCSSAVRMRSVIASTPPAASGSRGRRWHLAGRPCRAAASPWCRAHGSSVWQRRRRRARRAELNVGHLEFVLSHCSRTDTVGTMLDGPVQIAYAVGDVDAAAAQWVAQGVGPFFVLDHVEVHNVRVHQQPGRFDHSSAFAQWGDVMVELICQHERRPDPIVAGPACTTRPTSSTTSQCQPGLDGSRRRRGAVRGDCGRHAVRIPRRATALRPLHRDLRAQRSTQRVLRHGARRHPSTGAARPNPSAVVAHVTWCGRLRGTRGWRRC